MKDEELEQSLNKGWEIAGSTVGAAIGLMGGPVGSIAGSAVGTAIAIVLKDITHKYLSNRERVRIGASASYIITGVNSRLVHGAVIRQDQLTQSFSVRSSAVELLEGVLLKCKDEYQEKKIVYISKIIENVVFDDTISAEAANQVLLMVDKFTYRQLCIISLFGQCDLFDFNMLISNPLRWYNEANLSIQTRMFYHETVELMSYGIIQTIRHETFNDIIPKKLKLSPIGQIVFTIMALGDIPKVDLDLIFEEFKYKQEYGLTGQEQLLKNSEQSS